MILGIGIDTTEIERFNDWHTYTKEKLQKIFSDEEISHCLKSETKSAERFAVRFAAREALFKSLGSYKPDHTVPFLTLCKKTKILQNQNGVPYVELDWHYIKDQMNLDQCNIFISMTHAKDTATAWIILEK